MGEPPKPDTAPVTGSGWRTTEEPGRGSGAGPLVLLLGGVGLAIVGVLVLSYGVLLGFTHMDHPDPSQVLDVALQWIGLVSIPAGVLMVVASIAWWIWRVVRQAAERR